MASSDVLPDAEASQKSDVSEPNSLESSQIEKVHEVTCEKTKLKRIYKRRNVFSWEKYLEATSSVKCPIENFRHCDKTLSTELKEGMKLESIDPKHPWLFCMVTVMEKRAFRLRINFDGYAPCYDFLCHVNCPFLLPVNWCRRNQKILDKGKNPISDWDQLNNMSECFATDELFPNVPDSKIASNKYVIEAVDHNNTMRVARIIENIGDYVLAKFEALPLSCSKWFCLSSPCIKPFGWCSQNNVSICAVSADYLSINDLSALPSTFFSVSGTPVFSIGQKLEAVDHWNPIIVRICTIVDTFTLDGKVARLKLAMDGWSPNFSFWVDSDSDEIFYPGFCSATGYPLAWPTDFGPTQLSSCPTPECTGQGHVKGPRFLTHHNVAGCPYSSQCTRIPDRLAAGIFPVSHKLNRQLSPDSKPTSPDSKSVSLDSKSDFLCSKSVSPESKSVSPDSKTASHSNPISVESKAAIIEKHTDMTNGVSVTGDEICGAGSFESPLTNEPVPTHSVNCKKPKLCCDDSSTGYQPQELLERAIYNSVFGQPAIGPFSDLALCFNHQHKLLPTFEKPLTEVSTWTPEDVAKFVSSIPGCDGDVFIREQIDGEAFQLLTQADIVRLLDVKMGPALKIYHGIQLLQNNH